MRSTVVQMSSIDEIFKNVLFAPGQTSEISNKKPKKNSFFFFLKKGPNRAQNLPNGSNKLPRNHIIYIKLQQL